MIDVADRKQLFIDHRFVEDPRSVRLTVNPPIGREVVMESETPWEAFRVFFGSVVDTGGGYRMYYTDMAFVDGRATTHLCLAESDDGRCWRRPKLGLFEFQCRRDTNIIAPYLHGAPHYDPAAPFPHPYMMIGTLSGLFDPDGLKPPSEIGDPTKHARLRDPVFGITCDQPNLFGSDDGVRWKVVAGPLSPVTCDNWTNQIFYDRRLSRFVSYLRGFPNSRRTVHRYETDNPGRIPWFTPRPDATPDGYGSIYITSELPCVMTVEDQAGHPTDVQNPAVVPYPWADQVYLAFPSLHRWYPGPPERPDVGAQHRFRFFNDGLDDVHLFVSRDGVAWHRPSPWPYAGLGVWGEHDGGSLFTGLGLVRRGDEIWQYYTACRGTHGAIIPTQTNTTRIVLVRQRLDGFVSLDADDRRGSFVTPPLRFVGRRLFLNINCSALGEAFVELQDDAGRPIAGHTFAEADPIDRNLTAAPVTWKGRDDLSDLADRPIRLAFRLRLAKLYAFQFTC